MPLYVQTQMGKKSDVTGSGFARFNRRRSMLMDSVKGIDNSFSIVYTADFLRPFVVVHLLIDRYERTTPERGLDHAIPSRNRLPGAAVGVKGTVVDNVGEFQSTWV